MAVLPVILFHLGLPFTPGGFVGVDVFFVLSGYLITRQIALDLAENKFSLLEFYDRRIRRLFPALFAMLAGSTILAVIVLLPRDLDDFGESLAATVISISNFYFWHVSGYFAPAAETMPLLHTWSLAVEEQFYLIFPLLLMLLWRYAHAYVWRTLAALALLSFAASIWAVGHAPETAFYLLPTRAWELLLGSLLALAPGLAPRSSSLRNLAVGLGLAAIAVAVLAFQAGMPFPGLAAALPCLGAALVIWGGEPGPSAGPPEQARPLTLRLLSWPPLVFIGLISYSLYLWHWPLLVFATQWSPTPLSLLETALVAAASFGVAALSWKFVEQPLRRGQSLWTTRRLRVRYSGVAVVALALIGIMLDIGGGFPSIQPKAVLAVVDDARDKSPIRERCHFERSEFGRRPLSETCVFGAPSKREVIVFADSFGAELSFALSEIAAEQRIQARQITASACPPMLGYMAASSPGCERHNELMMKGLAEKPPSTILLAAAYFARLPANEERRVDFWRALERTVSLLRQAGHEVVLLGAWPPHPNGDLPHTLAKELRRGRQVEDYVFNVDPVRAKIIDENLQSIADRQDATYLPLLKAICGDTRTCRAYVHGQSIYFDGRHISMSTARHVVRDVILPALDARAADGALPKPGK